LLSGASPRTRQVILIASARVVLLDWDIQSLAHGNVVPWLQHMRERTMIWFRRLKPLRGLPKVYIEPADNGYAIIEAARAQGCKVADGRTTRDGRADEDRQIGARQAHDLNLLLLIILLKTPSFAPSLIDLMPYRPFFGAIAECEMTILMKRDQVGHPAEMR
jgi:hypothetical protein